MDRSFLYGIIILLAITDGLIYIQRTDPSLIAKFIPNSSADSWQNKDPGWDNKTEPKKESKPEPKVQQESNDSSDKKLDESTSDSDESTPKSNGRFRLFRCRP